jgi:peroxiredoxin
VKDDAVDMSARRCPIAPGEPAPAFSLPAVNRDGVVSLADYLGKSPLLLALMRGLYCAFCRRHVAQLGTTAQKLRPDGIETLAVVAIRPERARLYYRYRPVGVPVAADPELLTHRAYGVPQPPLSAEIAQAVSARHLELARDLHIPATTMPDIKSVLCEIDGFDPVEAEQRDRRDWSEQHGAQMIGQFLIDREGIVRWANIEGEQDGLAGLEKFPSDEEILAAARLL